MKQLIIATVIATSALGAYTPSQAADLGPNVGAGVRHGRTTWHRNYADPCSWAGHYCLYAFDGYVYHYPWHVTPYDAYFSRRVVRARG
jgi:hypothetical protein